MECFVTDYNIERQEGVEYAVLEDSIMHKNKGVSAGSKIMEGFVSPIEATVVSRLEKAGITILGKTQMDEFGIRGLYADNPETTSGAVVAVAKGIADFALCNDYTGSVGQQAAAVGLFYLHPTYGTVSRYGLIPAAASMDQIGIVCRNPQDGFRVLSLIAGYDGNDGAMIDNSEFGIRNSELVEESGKLRIAVPGNVGGDGGHKPGVAAILEGFTIVDVELEYFDVYRQVMQILCFGEISCNISRYDGISFGYRTGDFNDLQELYTKSRTEALGEGGKLAALIGSMVLSEENYSRYYDKAMRIRRLIKDSLDFDKYDGIVIPNTASSAGAASASGETGASGETAASGVTSASGVTAASSASGALSTPSASGGLSNVAPATGFPPWRLELHALPRLCGLPALTIPISEGSVTIIGNAGREDILKKITESIKGA